MEVRKDFAKRVAKLSESTPREAIANLLSALMPRVPAKVRAPEHPADAAERQRNKYLKELVEELGDPLADVSPSDPLDKLQRRAGRAPRTRKPAIRYYEVLNPHATGHHKRGTWTYAMVHCIVASPNAQAAYNMLREQYPEHRSRTLDFNWAAERGYIK